MRRPLVLASVLYVFLVGFLLLIRPVWWKQPIEIAGQNMTLCGYIYQKEYRMQGPIKVPVLYLKSVSMNASDSSEKIQYKVLCYLQNDDKNLRPGEQVCLQGKGALFSPATNPGEFDAAKYYQIQGIGFSLKKCEILSATKIHQWPGNLYDLKCYASGLFHTVLPSKDATVMDSLLLGESTLLDADTKSLYKKSGIIHILAISGLHVSLLGMGLFRLLQKLKVPKALAIGLAGFFMLFYGCLTGFGPSSKRAIAMFLLQLFAGLVGRTYDMATGLAVAALLILIEQPLYLFHSGFMLSFGSVLSLLVLHPVWKDVVPKRLAPGLALFSGTFPIHLWYYFQVVPYAIFINLLVVPCMPLLMILGILCLVLAFVNLHLAGVPAVLIRFCLFLFDQAGQVSLKIPGHQWIVGKPSGIQVILYLTILVIICLLYKQMTKQWILMSFIVAILFITARFEKGLQITALDVGQGDCFYVTDHERCHILIDGGSSSKKKTGNYQITPYLKWNGVTELDAVFVSHLDDDHYNGIVELLEESDGDGVQIRHVFLSAAVDKTEEKYIQLMELASMHHVAVEFVGAGAIYTNGKINLSCLYPDAYGANGTKDSNETSMVLLLQYRDFSVLFTGDLEKQGERMVTEKVRALLPAIPGQRITVLKVAHHGSNTSSSEPFLSIVRPVFACISVGAQNLYGHPHKETLERLQAQEIRVLRTDESGALTIRTDGKKVRVERYKKEIMW